jgi:hypothetical protein
VSLLLPNPIGSLKRKYAGRGTNITVDGWFTEPDPNPPPSQIGVPRIIVLVSSVICPASTNYSTHGLLLSTNPTQRVIILYYLSSGLSAAIILYLMGY